jgi:hypothetical protein
MIGLNRNVVIWRLSRQPVRESVAVYNHWRIARLPAMSAGARQQGGRIRQPELW